MGDVVAAVEIVVRVDLPVAVDSVSLPREEVEVADVERRDALDRIAEKLSQRRRGAPVDFDEDEVSTST
jgi:hypothetical protein